MPLLRANTGRSSDPWIDHTTKALGLTIRRRRSAGRIVATPVIDGLITLTSAMLGRDFRTEGRNLESLGLSGKTVPEIRAIVEHGPYDAFFGS